MNKKILIAAIVIIMIICAGAFALINMQSGNGASIDIDANALEDKGTLVVDSEDVTADKGVYSSSSGMSEGSRSSFFIRFSFMVFSSSL